MEAGLLRHRIDIQQLATDTSGDLPQDEHGDPELTWATWATGVPAQKVVGQSREGATGDVIVSEWKTRFRIRWRPGLVPTMRILHGSDVWNIAGIEPDNDSGRDFVWLPVTAGVNDG